MATALGGTRGIPPATALGIPRRKERWVLELVDEEPDATSIRPRLGQQPPDLGDVRAAAKLSEILGPLELDPLIVLDDPTYRRRLRTQANLPPEVANRL